MFKNILLPVDLNHESSWRKALPLTVDLCAKYGANLHVMTVLPNFRLPLVAGYFPQDFEAKAKQSANKHLHEFVAQHVPKSVPVQHIVVEGTVYEEILRMIKQLDIDLIVMASHRPELQDYLIGPNSSRVVRHSPVSVMVVRG